MGCQLSKEEISALNEEENLNQSFQSAAKSKQEGDVQPPRKEKKSLSKKKPWSILERMGPEIKYIKREKKNQNFIKKKK